MDDTLQKFTADSNFSASKSLGKLDDDGFSFFRDTVLRLDSPGASTSCFSKLKGTKKCSVIDGSKVLQDGFSLVLGLGCSASTQDRKGSSAAACTAISSAKEIGDGSSMDLDLDFHLHLGNKWSPNAKKFSNVTPKALEVERPKLDDLQLSLSIGPIKSDITNFTSGSTPFENNSEMPVIASTVQLVDEGSTSARWRSKQLLPPLNTVHNTKAASAFDLVPNHINPSLIIPNLSSTMLAVPEGSVCASGITHQQLQRNTSLRTCLVLGCGRGARGASGRCISHGGGRRCQKDGCQKGAEGKTVFCKAHGGGRRCQRLGCTKSAEGSTDFCISHGGGRRCSHEDCTRAARGKSGLCIRHGGGKRCQMENCSKSAEGLSGLCISHGGGRRCQRTGCTKGAQGSTMFCKAHGGGKRCTALGCTKGAEGSTPFCKGHGGGKRCSYEGGGVCPKSVHGGTLFCVRHGGGKRCASAGCTKSARGRTNFCVRHGGGKRCKHEGCGKSAQGSTDYCKAHGGGKQCSWGQLGSEIGGQAVGSCERLARGNSGFCAAHIGQMEDKRVHGVDTLGPTLQGPESSTSEKIKEVVTFEKRHADGTKTAGIGQNLAGWGGTDSTGFGHQMVPMHIPAVNNFLVGQSGAVLFSLPEGRVHGGGLMAMLRGGIGVGSTSNIGGPSEPGKSYPSWV
ncbi:hypothetical protein L1049_013746 [Liquidambar formosana]|uniref:WRKY19-like zinc finger domain-containing protein n=1 Tax=Liquidambar formosana TaxID=63359 RepID=A0AAP0WX36_LIQFO